jgi:hypothetical protein
MINFPHKVIVPRRKFSAAEKWCSTSLSAPGGVWFWEHHGAWADEKIAFKFALAKHAMLFELVWKY